MPKQNTTITPDVVRQVMAYVGAKGGRTRTEAKAKASRSNGSLGGRRPNSARDAEQRAYEALCATALTGDRRRTHLAIKAWIRACGRYRNIIRARWLAAFGPIDQHI